MEIPTPSPMKPACYGVTYLLSTFPHGVPVFLIATPASIRYLVGISTMTQLIGTQLLETAVKATIATGRVENSDNGPLSLLLIAAPESGKTSIVSRDCSTTESFTDITGRGIMETLKKKPHLTHIIILDMVAIMSHKQHVNQYTQSILNAMTEEGVGTVAYPTQTDTFPSGKKGLIACLTVDLVKDGRHWWNKTGFATRMLPLCFDHSKELIVRIKQSISAEKNATQRPSSSELVLPDKGVTVLLPDDIGKRIQFIADMKAQQFGEKGYRRLKQFRALAKGHALLRSVKKPMVTQVDVDFIESLMPYISFEVAHPI